jgi:hypothetical protein
MAITTTTITKNAGWARTEVITQLEEAFTWLGWHGDQVVGIVTGIAAYSGGGTTTGYASSFFPDVRQVSTSGVGTGASFYVTRNGSGIIDAIYVDRPGSGYVNNEIVQISGASVGSSVGIAITVSVSGGASPTGFGSTNEFYAKQVTGGTNSPWGVLRHVINSNKAKGTTYRAFQVYGNNYQMLIGSGSAFQPGATNITNRGLGYGTRFAGVGGIDRTPSAAPYSSGVDYLETTASVSNFGRYSQLDPTRGQFATSNSPTTHALKLNIYRSGIDPRFAVLSYSQPTVANSSITDNTFLTFILHNFDSTLWDLDHVFLGGLTTIHPNACSASGNNTAGRLEFRTFVGGNGRNSGSNTYEVCYGTAEGGYMSRSTGSSSSQICYTFDTTSKTLDTFTTDPATNYQGVSYTGSRIFTRRSSSSDPKSVMDVTDSNGYSAGISTFISSAVNYNAVIKGSPLNGNLVPCPYYLPDDFVIIDFRYATAATNIQQGDTITISGSEVYTVITGSYSQYNETAGLLFCARKV